MSDSTDHFSTQADVYAQARPRYPDEMFAWLAGLAARHSLAWDAGCGNGQASVPLASHFERVAATDVSAEQLRHAEPHERVEYIETPAESVPLEDASVDLIAAAQSAHWFDHDAFYREARRVAAPGAVIALVTYEMLNVSARIDPLLYGLANQVIGEFWPRERGYVDTGYATLPFPFEEIVPPPFEMRADWTADQMMDYLLTWSATQRYIEYYGTDPRTAIDDQVRALWGETRTIRWRIAMRVGYLNAE